MGKEIIKALDVEINHLKTDKIKEFVIKILEKCDDVNAVGAASSSGKYHPMCDLGDGGLIRHTKIVCRNVETLLRTNPIYDEDLDWDVVYASAILHDMCKYRSGTEHSFISHPVDMAKLIRDNNDTKSRAIERIASNVETHMSRWNKSTPDGKGEPMPLPKNVENLLVSFADMIGSQKWFYAKFDENNNLVNDVWDSDERTK